MTVYLVYRVITFADSQRVIFPVAMHEEERDAKEGSDQRNKEMSRALRSLQLGEVTQRPGGMEFKPIGPLGALLIGGLGVKSIEHTYCAVESTSKIALPDASKLILHS